MNILNKSFIKIKCYWRQIVMTSAIAVALGSIKPIQAFAGIKNDINSISKNKEGGTAFNSATKKATTLGKSGISLLNTISVTCGLICIGLAAVSWIVTKNANKHEENKSWMVRILIGLSIAFGAGSLVLLVYQIAASVK